ncbi:Multidrug resistance-associated ABC transporter protein [Mycena indigotica]|uniref:Multidrug resistance-associated ABC transporter protein n=1 Tax=Mycena indigotica TaxID=2126181 RepID=A0A8H6VT09_9AGAR|nr:Multidrug resistance-associated ABC transporter protein [Mycena indigotica]KAF7292829.1 Multidrug resistance-associated ABC transporter protein [Mycena indigotica]
MPRYQLEATTALTSGALLSAVLFFVNRTKDGKIRLEENEASDPFDVTTAEDLTDGYPLQEEKFWSTMKRRKMLLSVLASLLLCVQLAAAALDSFGQISCLRVAFSFYIATVAVFSIRRQSVFEHTESIWHLSALNFVPVPLLGFTAIIPDDYHPVSSVSVHAPTILWYTALGLHLVVALIAANTPCGPALHYPPEAIYSEKIAQAITNTAENNVAGIYGASPLGILFFSYSTKVVMLGNTAASLEIGDLPILTVDMRASHLYDSMKRVLRTVSLRIPFLFWSWQPRVGSGITLGYQLLVTNKSGFLALILLSLAAGGMFYMPPLLLSGLLRYLESDLERQDFRWGLVWVAGLLCAHLTLFTLTGQVWSLATATLQAKLRNQLNTVLFAKTLLRKDIASTAPTSTANEESKEDGAEKSEGFSSKAQIMTLMFVGPRTLTALRGLRCTSSVLSANVPIEIIVGTTFLYKLLGVSSLFGLGIAIACLPLNHFAGKAVSGAQDNLMKSRDQRVALMNEVLGGIRMLKFMAWERSFEDRILKIRSKELKYQRLNYIIESLLEGFWSGIPVIITLVSFYHFAVIRGEVLKPSIAFTSIIVFNELRFALSLLTGTFINIVQSAVSLRRIETYLGTREISLVPDLSVQTRRVAFNSCTVTWPQDTSTGSTPGTSAASTPRQKFLLLDLSFEFPEGQLSLVCGKLGSGKTLLLLALLGEADVVAGQLSCPRSPANTLASFAGFDPAKETWLVDGVCAYVPQTAWLQNASIKDNILFSLPYDDERYRLTLEACALVSDLAILDDGDDSEIGERGVCVIKALHLLYIYLVRMAKR